MGFVLMLLCAIAATLPTSAPTTTAATAPARYRIYVDTDRPGLRQDLSITVTYKRQRTLRRDGKVTRSDENDFTLEFEGAVEVLAAERGEATKLSVTVGRLIKQEDGGDEEILPDGSVVMIESSGRQPKYSLKDSDQPLDPYKTWYVQTLFSTKRDGEPAIQDTYGSSTPQPVGATWPISMRNVARSYALQSITVNTDRSRGETRFVGTEQRDGKTYAHIEMTANLEMKVPAAKGWKQTHSSARMAYALLAPTDADGATLDSASVYESTIRYLRYIGRNETEREVSEDRLYRTREVKVIRPVPLPPGQVR